MPLLPKGITTPNDELCDLCKEAMGLLKAYIDANGTEVSHYSRTCHLHFFHDAELYRHDIYLYNYNSVCFAHFVNLCNFRIALHNL